MNSLSLVKSQNEFNDFAASLNWEDAFVKETSCVSFEHLSRGGIATGVADPFLRMLIALPYEPETPGLEIVAFEVTAYRFWNGPIENLPTATIRRREAVIDMGGNNIRCACIAYRRLEREHVEFGTRYSRDEVFCSDEEYEEYAAPYNIDWRTEIDLASNT